MGIGSSEQDDEEESVIMRVTCSQDKGEKERRTLLGCLSIKDGPGSNVRFSLDEIESIQARRRDTFEEKAVAKALGRSDG